MTTRSCLSFLLIAWSSLAVADGFVPDDQLVSDPLVDLPQPEFDQLTRRIIWQDRANQLWVGNVDPVTGALSPVNGKGKKVDTALAPAGQVGNTPRYTYGTGQNAIVYTTLVGSDFALAKAVEVAPNTWQTSLLSDGIGRWKANGTPEETTSGARIVYNRETAEGETVVSWRDLDDPTSEGTVSAAGQGGRFLGAEPALLVLKNEVDPPDLTQIWEVPFATGEPVQITFGPDDKLNPFIWWAPEYHDYLFVVMINFFDLAVYRRIEGVWTNVYQFQIPSAKPKLSSPEGFVVNGRSYIAVVTCDQLGSGGFAGQPVGPSEIWLAGIDPSAPFFRRIDDPSYPAQRSEPEPYMLNNGSVVFYTEYEVATNTRMVKRATTGIAADLGYDIASYGGPWSSAFRDNKNCACTPYAIGDAYEAANSAPVPNAQYAHATLGPEDQLYFTIAETTPTETKNYLVAVASGTGAETYRIDEKTATTRLSMADTLIDENGDYYVAANEALSKFTATGTRLWRVPIKGLAPGAQFTPDGNVLFMTWNGWAYVVKPDGTILLERNLTPGRVYPADPSCLATGTLASDCAYVGPPAVDAFSNRVFVTQIRTRGDSVLQAFRYQTTPTVDLKSLWAARSPVLPGVATSPVLSADYTRAYVQDGAGNLVAVNTASGQRVWSFPLGFVSNEPPVVSRSGYIMPGGSVDEDARYAFVGVLHDLGTSAQWVVQDLSYSPRSRGAAGAGDRFAVAARDTLAGNLRLLVVGPGGVVSATPWGGVEPATLGGLTLRDDGWVFVQTWGQEGVRAFRPLP